MILIMSAQVPKQLTPSNKFPSETVEYVISVLNIFEEISARENKIANERQQE